MDFSDDAAAWTLGRREDVSRGAAADTLQFCFDPAEPTPSRAGAVLDMQHGNMGRLDVSLECGRNDVIYLDSGILEKPLEIAGRPFMVVSVEACGCDSCDLFVRLLDVTPDGRVLPVCDGIRRLLPGNLDPPVLPGVIREDADELPRREVRVDLDPVAASFARGHRLRILISGGSFPRFERNKGFAADGTRGTRMRPQNIKLHSGSFVTLPVLGGEAAALSAWRKLR